MVGFARTRYHPCRPAPTIARAANKTHYKSQKHKRKTEEYTMTTPAAAAFDAIPSETAGRTRTFEKDTLYALMMASTHRTDSDSDNSYSSTHHAAKRKRPAKSPPSRPRSSPSEPSLPSAATPGAPPTQTSSCARPSPSRARPPR